MNICGTDADIGNGVQYLSFFIFDVRGIRVSVFLPGY